MKVHVTDRARTEGLSSISPQRRYRAWVSMSAPGFGWKTIRAYGVNKKLALKRLAARLHRYHKQHSDIGDRFFFSSREVLSEVAKH